MYPGDLTIIHHFSDVTNYPVLMDFYALSIHLQGLIEHVYCTYR